MDEITPTEQQESQDKDSTIAELHQYLNERQSRMQILAWVSVAVVSINVVPVISPWAYSHLGRFLSFVGVEVTSPTTSSFLMVVVALVIGNFAIAIIVEAAEYLSYFSPFNMSGFFVDSGHSFGEVVSQDEFNKFRKKPTIGLVGIQVFTGVTPDGRGYDSVKYHVNYLAVSIVFIFLLYLKGLLT